jgi:hypothetical protein
MKTHVSLFKAFISYLVSACLLITGTLPGLVAAQSHTCSSVSDSGQDPKCASKRIGGTAVAYQKLDWRRISDLPSASKVGESRTQDSSATNRAAVALGIEASELASIAATFPVNVPYVVGRYNPLDSTLRIDLFKLERVLSGTTSKAGLYQAQFGPSHGDIWKAARSYISPSEFKAGTVPGVNPFAAFQTPGNDNFSNISLAAAQVAVGHAMRLTGTPFALLAVSQPRVSSREESTSSWFKKTQKVWVYGHSKPLWYIAQTTSTLARTSTLSFAAFCAADPAAEDCPGYGMAVSGVAFEQFEGGTLNDTEERWELDYKENSGFTFLAMVIIGVFASFAMVGLIGAMGASGAVGGVAGSTSTVSGGLGQMLQTFQILGAPTSIASAVAVEATLISGGLVLGGANLGSTFDTSPENVLIFRRVSKGISVSPTLSEYQTRLNTRASPRTTDELVSGTSLPGVRTTVTGDCSLSSLARNCAGSVAGAGVISRPDELKEQNDVAFMRDNSGELVNSHFSGN